MDTPEWLSRQMGPFLPNLQSWGTWDTHEVIILRSKSQMVEVNIRLDKVQNVDEYASTADRQVLSNLLFQRAMRSRKRIVSSSRYCHDVRPSVCLSLWDERALQSYGAL